MIPKIVVVISCVVALSASAVAQSHDPREPFSSQKRTDAPSTATQPVTTQPVYRIYPLRNGTCAVNGSDAFYHGNPAESYEFSLYVWLILGGEKPILVDAGLIDVAAMNKGAARVLAKPIVQRPEETVAAQLNHFGLTPKDIGHVLVTHLHFDHVDGIEQYTNALIHIGRREFEGATAHEGAGSWCDARILDYLCNKAKDRVRLADDDATILPGIKAIWLGGHTPGSTAYQVSTRYGRAVLTGDTISLLANYERNAPPGVFADLDQCYAAIRRVRKEADIVLPSHDPDAARRWPPRAKPSPLYTIRALKCGECQVRDYITYQGCGDEQPSAFCLYVFVIEGGERPIIIDTGPKDPEGFSRATAKYIPGGVKQSAEERTPELLRRNGIDPARVSHVVVTHLHPDHYDYFDAFPNAQLVVNRHGFLASLEGIKPDVMRALAARWPRSLRMAEDEEILPGIRTVPLGCHSPCSQAVVVRTEYGPVVFTGDVAYKYENVETDRVIASGNPGDCREAIRRVREISDLFIPAHDPLVLKRWPGGRIGALP